MSHTIHDMTKKELKAEVATLERDLATARKELEATAKELSAARAALDFSQGELREMNDAHETMMRHHEVVTKLCDKQDDELADLRQQLTAANAELVKARKELGEARATSKVLNRRAQEAEGIIAKAGLVENRPQGKHGRSLGRALANYAASKFKEERDSLHAALTAANAEADRLREAVQGVFTDVEWIAKRGWNPMGTVEENSRLSYDCHCVAAGVLTKLRAALAARKGTT